MSTETQQAEFPGLVPIHQEQGELWVDARALHTALRVGRDFSTWVQGRLAEVDALENEEFIVLDGSPILGNGFNPKPRRDYWLSLDLAKEVAMLERNEVGKQVRRYFIEAERQLRARSAALALPNFEDPVLAARAWADAKEAEQQARAALEASQAQLERLAPQAQQFRALMSADGTYSVADAAKLLGTGERRLFALLRERGILMDKARSGDDHHNIPYQAYLDRGYFEVITRPRPGGDSDRVTKTPRVTPKGLGWLERKLRELQPAPALPSTGPAPPGPLSTPS